LSGLNNLIIAVGLNVSQQRYEYRILINKAFFQTQTLPDRPADLRCQADSKSQISATHFERVARVYVANLPVYAVIVGMFVPICCCF